MAEQIRSTKTSTDKGTDSADGIHSASAGSVASERLKDEIDDLLDEIDEVLETNSEEFVKNYVQKGGE